MKLRSDPEINIVLSGSYREDEISKIIASWLSDENDFVEITFPLRLKTKSPFPLIPEKLLKYVVIAFKERIVD